MAKYSRLCVDFNGSTKFASAGNVLDKTDTSTFSIAAWVKVDSAATGNIISKIAVGGAGYALRIDALADIIFSLDDGAGGLAEVRSFYALHDANVARWVFYVATYDGSTNASGMLLYADGRPMRQTTVTDLLAGSITNAAALTIAGIDASANFGSATLGNGLIDGVAMWNDVLTPAEVLSLYNAREPSDYNLIVASGLDSHWRMGDGDTHPTLLDDVGANDMTLTGTTAADILDFRTAGGWPVQVAELGPGIAPATYVMFGHDQQCIDGVAPTPWESVGAPDPTGALAPAFPCGGPWESIWVGQIK